MEYAPEYISFQTHNTQHMEQKAAITNDAASMVKEHQVVALDYGSTSQMMAIALKKNFRSLTVITNSVQNAMILAECPDFTPMLDFLHIDILFMTVTGIDSVTGCTDFMYHFFSGFIVKCADSVADALCAKGQSIAYAIGTARFTGMEGKRHTYIFCIILLLKMKKCYNKPSGI